MVMSKAFEKLNMSPAESKDYGQDNIKQSKSLAKQTIALMVENVESSFWLINEEFEEATQANRLVNEEKIENWSREIDELCLKIGNMPICNLQDLQAKINLNLMLMSRSMMDQHEITLYSNNIIDSLDQFKEAHAMISVLKTG